MPTDRFTFPGHAGHDLAARLDLPQGPHLATALFAHCFTCGKDIPAARRISARLAAMGIAVLRFDFTGLGHSAGEFENTTLSSNVADLRSACAALAERGMAPSLLIGHSLGGAAVLEAAPDLPDVQAVVTLGAPYNPAHVTHHFSGEIDRILAEGSAEVSLAGRPFTIGRDFVEDIRRGGVAKAVPRLNAALLVMHAPRDDTVGIENASDIFRAAKHPKSFVTLDDADHLISRPEDAEYAAGIIAAWAGRYLDLAAPAPPPGVPEGVLRISEADPGGFLQDIQSGSQHMPPRTSPKATAAPIRASRPRASSSRGSCLHLDDRSACSRRRAGRLAMSPVDVNPCTRSTGMTRAPHQSEDRQLPPDDRLTGDLDADQRGGRIWTSPTDAARPPHLGGRGRDRHTRAEWSARPPAPRR